MTDSASCNAWIPELGAECGRPGSPVRRACVHEHVREANLCLFHRSVPGMAQCRPCHEIDGHDCPITIVDLATGAAL